MTLFRTFLLILLVIIVSYTLVVGLNHGWDLIPIFFRDMLAMNWPGQFNLDFMTFLMMSALWVGWRNRFSPIGLLLMPFAFLGGMLFLSIYLLYLTGRHRDDMETILLGPERAPQS